MVSVKAYIRTCTPLALLLLSTLPMTHTYGPVKIPGLAKPCDATNHCPENANCVGNYCACVDGYVHDDAGETCLPKTTHWQGACTDNSQCLLFNNSVCRGGSCQCKEDSQFLSGQCWVSKHLGEECTDSNQCTLSINQDRIACSGGTCKCKSPYHENEHGDECDGANTLWSLGLTSLLLFTLTHLLFN